MMIRFTLILSLCLLSAHAFAGDVQAAFEALKNTKVNYSPDGAVCEQLARLKVRETYPENAYDITGDIEYDLGALTIGELDVVVIEKSSQKVVLVEEVKCWKSFDGAKDKAVGQKTRFMWNLTKFPEKIRFTSYDGTKLTAANFSSSFPFIFVSQAGGVRHGFDQELDFTLQETEHLRMQLLKCQDLGPCPKPE